MRRWLASSALLSLFGASGGGCGTSKAEAACHDYLDVSATAVDRCGIATYQETLTKLEQATNCSKAKGIRDEAELRNTCLPAMKAISCTDLKAGTNFPISCKGQILM